MRKRRFDPNMLLYANIPQLSAISYANGELARG